MLKTKKNLKAQGAVEMMIITSATLVILVTLIAVNQDVITTTGYMIERDKAAALIGDISSAAELVYHQGVGAKTRVFVTVPDNVDTIDIGNKTMKITFANEEVVYRNLDFNVSGNLPTDEGNQWVIIESLENYTRIYTEAYGYCGNQVQEVGEKCDGDDLNEEECVTLGYDGGDLACYTNCTFDYSSCTTCGDGLAEGDEQCDGADLRGETCQSQGFDGGTLACYVNNCTFNTSGCYTDYPPYWTVSAGADNTNPKILSYVEFYSKWDDDYGLTNYMFSWNAGGIQCNIWVNGTWTSFQAGNWTNTTKRIPFWCGSKNITYRFYANDSNGQLNETSGSIKVQPSRRGMIVYYDSDNYFRPQYRIWNGTGLESPSSATSLGSGNSVHGFNKLVSSPTQDEKILITQDDSWRIMAQTWDGSSWSSLQSLSNDLNNFNRRQFDIAYEQSGEAVVVYKHQNSYSRSRYRTWDGSWTSHAYVETAGSNDISWIRLEASPNDDEMILVVLDSGRDLYAQVWDGDGWGNVQLLDNNVETASKQLYDIAFESQSGNAIVAYGHRNSVTVRYWTWNGTWSGEYDANDADDQDIQWLRLVSDPNSDTIVMGVEPNNKHMNLQVWNGDSWGSNHVVGETLETHGDRNFDIAWESQSGRAVAVYGKSNTDYPRYVIWNGSSWSSSDSALNIGGDQNWIQLASNPEIDEILMLAIDNQNSDLWLQRWNGTVWTAEPEVENKCNNNHENFYISYDIHG